jgi:hypothetical protein
MTANSLRGGFGARIFFLHVPKCGGMSVHDAIVGRYGIVEKLRGHRRFDHPATYAAAKALNPAANPFSVDDYEILKFREHLLLYFMSQERSLYISGHFAFSEPAYKTFGEKFTFVTMLREPVKRWISYYFYGKHNGSIALEPGDFLKTDYARSQGYEMVKFIGGPIAGGDYASREAIDRAKENLGKFHIVGALEHQDDFASKFKMRFGVDLRLDKINKSPVAASRQSALITPEIESKIREICGPDLEVYKHAVERYVKK